MAFRVAVLGASKMARKHLLCLKELAGVEIGFIYSRSLDLAERLARECSTASPIDELQALKAGSVDLAIVTSEPSRHLELARDCVEKGIPVLIEKPLALDLNEARSFKTWAKSRSAWVSVVSQQRFHPDIVELKEKVAPFKNKPGFASLKIFWKRDSSYYSEGNGWRAEHNDILCNQAIHWVDVLNDFFGKPMECNRLDHETRDFLKCSDQALLSLMYPGGLMVSLGAGTFFEGTEADRFEIHSGERQLSFPSTRWQKITKFIFSKKVNPLKVQLQGIIRDIQGQHPPEISLDDAVLALEVCLGKVNS